VWGRILRIGGIASSAALCSCTSLNFVHDPQTGVIGREQVQGIVKSTKCELITFFEANRRRKDHYFDLSEQLFGNIIFDLNVVDTAGFPPGGTSIDNAHGFNADSITWHVGPTLQGQNTYDMILSYIVPQDAKLSPIPGGDNKVTCYSGVIGDFEGLAGGNYPNLERFTRVKVNGVKPLAAWLLEVSSDLWPEMEAAKLGETAYPVQMSYAFTVQITGGVEVKYSLVNPVWNPLAPDVSASSQQTSKLTFALNGADASLASGANTGIAVIGGANTPPYVPPIPPRLIPRGAAPPAPGATPPSEQKRRPALKGQPRGHLLVPLPLVAPRPVH
jgi:hypothetical protein